MRSNSPRLPYSWVPFRDTLKRVDAHTWTVGDWLLLTRHFDLPAPEYSWPDGQGSSGYFSLRCYPDTLPPHALPAGKTVLMLEPRLFNQVEDHHTGGRWRIGDAYLSVCRAEDGPTHMESVLQELNKKNLSFQVPKVIWAASHGGRRYTLTSMIRGRRRLPSVLWVRPLKCQWDRIVGQIAEAYIDLAKITGKKICDLSGKPVSTFGLESFKPTKDGREPIIDPDSQLQNAKKARLNCSQLVLAHVLRPNAFVFNDADELIGIDSWCDAAFVPQDWVLTRMMIDSWRWADEGWTVPQAEYFIDILRRRMLAAGFRDCKKSWEAWDKGGQRSPY